MSVISRIWGLEQVDLHNRLFNWVVVIFIISEGLILSLWILSPKAFIPIMIASLLLFLFIFLLFHNPYYAFLVFIIAMIMTNQHFPFASILVLRERMLLMIMLIVFIISSGIIGKSLLRKGTFARPILAILFILSISALYGFIRGNQRYIVALEFEWYLYLIVYFIAVSLVRTFNNVKTLVKTIVIATVISAFIATITFFYLIHLNQMIFYKGSFGHLLFLEIQTPRVISNAEMFFPIAVNFILSFLLFVKLSTKNKLLLICALLILSFSIFISLTRGMWLSVIMSSLFIISYHFFRKGKRSFLVFIRSSILVIITLVVFSSLFANIPQLQRFIAFGAERFSQMVGFSIDLSLVRRYQEITQVTKALRAHPLFGLGLGAMVSWHDFIFSWLVHKEYFIHNSFFWILLKMGCIGIIVIAAVFFLLFKKVFKLLKVIESSHQRAVVVGMISGLISMLIFSITSPFANLGVGNFYFALVAGIISAMEEMR